MGLFLQWWYSEQFVNILKYFETFFVYLFDLFSVRVCLTTLFDVWRRDKTSYQGLSLPEILQAWSLNIVSRLIGAVVKTFTILAYLVVALFFLSLTLVFLLFWLLFPLIIIGLIYFGLINILGF